MSDKEYEAFMRHFKLAAQNYETPLLEYGIKYKHAKYLMKFVSPIPFIELISAGSPRRTFAGRAIMRGGRMRVRSAGRVHAASGMSPVFSEPRHLSPVMLS